MKASKARIFISYSHRGNGPEWKAWLVRHLSVFEQHHLLDIWQDGRIRVSSFWDDDIKQAMSNARLAVALLTKEALESEYILNTEFPFLRERQQRDKLPVFPVVCEPCNWKAHDWLRATQAPNESNPLSQLTEAAQDRVFRQLATDIAKELSGIVLAELPKPDQPPPPDHIYLDKFPLTRGPSQREEKLIGREQELALLDIAFAQPHTAIVSLVAWGGVGKTMLVQHWLQRLQREGWFGAQRVYAWSFYSQGTKEDRQASEDTFLAHALQWFGVQCEPTLSPWDKGRLLADAVARERTLLILDGIEPLQYPPGPMGGQLRAPGVQSLLKQLARKANSAKSEIAKGFCLATTREPLTDLADFERRPDAAWGSVLRVDLGNLTAEAGAALLHHAGANRAGAAEIKPDDKELLAASREVDGHALTLNLLGRFLAHAHGGDIRRRDLVKFAEADRTKQGGTTFKMLTAFENWFDRGSEIYKQQLAILRILGLFDRPADAGCLGALRKPPVIAGLTDPLFTTKLAATGQATAQPLLEEDWNTATSFLSKFGLVVIQADADNRECLLDCHPLIREHFAKQLCEQATPSWIAAHTRLYDHLKRSTIEYPDTLATLQPLYQSITHGCAARHFEEAFREVFVSRVRRGNVQFSVYQLGAYNSDLAALACFYSHAWTTPVEELSTESRAWIQHAVASALRSVGRLDESDAPMQAGIMGAVQSGDWNNSAVRTSNEALLVADRGNLEKAAALAASAVELADRARNPEQMILRRFVQAYVMCQRGKMTEGLDLFRQAERMLWKFGPADGRKILNGKNYGPLMVDGVGAFHHCDCLLGVADVFFWRLRLFPGSASFVFAQEDVGSEPLRTIKCRLEVARYRSRLSLRVDEDRHAILAAALHRLTLAWVDILWSLFSGIPGWHNRAYVIATRFARLFSSRAKKSTTDYERINQVIAELRAANSQHHVPRGLLLRARFNVFYGTPAASQADLDEAWDIAERGPMRLHLADIHLHRARLFFREKPYPWKSPQDDLGAAEKLINDCGYHRRDEELADAKKAILGQ